MMPKVGKALATLVVLVLLFIPTLRRLLPDILWVVLFIITLTYGISLLFSTQLPAHRRWSMAYLAFTGFTYLLAGSLGFSPGGLFEYDLWYKLVSPYPLLAILECLWHFPCTLSKAAYVIMPLEDERSRFFPEVVVVASAVAIVAAFAMPKKRKTAYLLWLTIVLLSFPAASSYVVADFFKWGTPVRDPWTLSTETIVALSLSGSYLVAYLMARIGVDFSSQSVSGEDDSSKQ